MIGIRWKDYFGIYSFKFCIKFNLFIIKVALAKKSSLTDCINGCIADKNLTCIVKFIQGLELLYTKAPQVGFSRAPRLNVFGEPGKWGGLCDFLAQYFWFQIFILFLILFLVLSWWLYGRITINLTLSPPQTVTPRQGLGFRF